MITRIRACSRRLVRLCCQSGHHIQFPTSYYSRLQDVQRYAVCYHRPVSLALYTDNSVTNMPWFNTTIAKVQLYFARYTIDVGYHAVDIAHFVINLLLTISLK